MPNSPRYCAYVDGSARPQSNQYGIGGVVIDTENHGRRVAFSRAVSDIKSCVEAEIYASIHALNWLPENSVVRLHTDCLVLADRINEGASAWNLSVGTSLALRNAYAEARDAIARHELVIAIHSTESQTRYILAAHRLAKAGAKGYGGILPGYFNNIAKTRKEFAANLKMHGERAIPLAQIRDAVSPLIQDGDGVVDITNKKGIRRLRDAIVSLPMYRLVFDDRLSFAA